MPATFTATRGAFTPSLSADNFTLYGGQAPCWVKAIGWGGRTAQTSAYRTRWVKPSSVTTPTTGELSIVSSNPAVTPVGTCKSNWSTQPTLPSDTQNMFAVDWNAQGGEGVLHMALWHRWLVGMSGSATTASNYLSCRNTAGIDASSSSYWISWEE